MKKRMTLLGLVAAVVALTATVTAGARTDAAAAPIKLMVIAPVATPIQNYPDAFAGAQAAAAALNKKGGIKGRQVEILTCNTQSNANSATACARQAVSEGVLAVVGGISTLSTIEFPILQQGGIPSVGFQTSGNPVDWTNPMSYPFVGGSTASYMAAPFAFKKLGKKRLVIIFQDVPSAATNAKLVRNAARTAGMPVVGTLQLPGATTDFAPYVQRLRQMEPDSAIFINSPGVSGGMIRNSVALGVRPMWMHNTGSIGEPEAAQIGAPSEGMLLGSIFPSFRDTARYPGIKRFVDEMRAAGKASDEINLKPLGINAWVSVYAVAEAATWVKGTLTPSSLNAAMRAQKKTVKIQGLVDWRPGAKGPAAFPRWTSIKVYWNTVKDGKIVAWGSQLPPTDVLVALKYVR
jgi:ABC-type branched-subunit amino acid transport system substrate-binding protein